MEEAQINSNLRNGNRELLVNVWDISKLLIGNKESGTSSLFLIWVYITNVSKVHIGNKEPVPGSF